MANYSFNSTSTVAYTIGTQSAVGSYGAIGAAGQFLTSGSNGTSWSTTSNSGMAFSTGSTGSSMSVNGNLDVSGNIKINGKDLAKMMEKIEDRLAILQEPDPIKLEKFLALKKAYDHYKLMEKLIGEE
jgi:hypothetical protein